MVRVVCLAITSLFSKECSNPTARLATASLGFTLASMNAYSAKECCFQLVRLHWTVVSVCKATSGTRYQPNANAISSLDTTLELTGRV